MMKCKDCKHGEHYIVLFKTVPWSIKAVKCGFKNDEPNNFCPNCGADMRGDIDV